MKIEKIVLAVKFRIVQLILTMVTVAVLINIFSFQTTQIKELTGSMARGKEIYNSYCISCHMEKGEGVANIYPPLAKSDYLMSNKIRSIREILFGIKGEIIVNGITYNSLMIGSNLSDKEVSEVLNYIRNSFGNKGDAVSPDEVKTERNNPPKSLK